MWGLAPFASKANTVRSHYLHWSVKREHKKSIKLLILVRNHRLKLNGLPCWVQATDPLLAIGARPLIECKVIEITSKNFCHFHKQVNCFVLKSVRLFVVGTFTIATYIDRWQIIRRPTALFSPTSFLTWPCMDGNKKIHCCRFIRSNQFYQ